MVVNERKQLSIFLSLFSKNIKTVRVLNRVLELLTQAGEMH